MKRKKETIENKQDMFGNIFEGKYKHIIFISLLFIILSASFFKMAFKNYAPPASDTIQWRGSAQCMMEYNEKNKDQALWNSNVFGGMPGYLISFGAKYPFINYLSGYISKVMSWRVFLMFMMGLGIYLLMIFMKFDPVIAFISAVAFSLSCHFLGLLEIGHNSKFRTVVYIPWIMFAVHYLKERKSVLAMALAAIMLIGQLRENHPQISYYTFLMLGIYWIFQLVYSCRDREKLNFLIFSSMLLAVFVISFISVAQPYFSTIEYGEYTIRGGSGGLDTGYATSWSFHPLEMLSFINPSFFGGVSPYYWGWMPFTQTSMYMGVIILLLAVFAVLFDRSRNVMILLTISIVTLFISFGRHLPFLSNFLLDYLPGFNKFRVPAMILVLLQFTTVILAGYGLKYIIHKFEEKDKEFFELVQKILIGVIILFILFFLTSGIIEKIGLSKAGEASKYSVSQIKQLKEMRMEKLINDGIQTGLLLIAALGFTLLLGKGKLKKYSYLLLIALLVIVDLLIVDKRFVQGLVPQKQIERYYKKTLVDNFLSKDKEIFRIYPLGREFGQNKWTYYNQSIGGYHGAKLKRYQEIIEHCLNAEFKNRIPINWNIVNMLNAKYVIFSDKLPIENLEYAYYDRKQKLTVYKNLDHLPRAWFIENVELIREKENIWKRLNQLEFDPAKTAIIEKDIGNIFVPDSSKVTLKNYELHDLKFEVKTDTTSFLVISESYYPAGWKAYIDGAETEIYAVNYILRGIVVPKGDHILEMKFAPKSYLLSIRLTLAGLITTLLLLVVGLFFYYRQNYKGEIIYVLKK